MEEEKSRNYIFAMPSVNLFSARKSRGHRARCYCTVNYSKITLYDQNWDFEILWAGALSVRVSFPQWDTYWRE